MKSPTRRQHYVWRFHLAAWQIDGKVAVLRKDGGGFLTNPVNVAVERDFYRLPRLTERDVGFIEAFIANMRQTDEQKDFTRGWLDAPAKAAALRQMLEAKGLLTPDVEKAIEGFEIEADEQMMGWVERNGQPYVERLRQEDSGFWAVDDAATIHFAYFLSVQHLRTKRVADLIAVGEIPSGDPGMMSRVWPILRLSCRPILVSLYTPKDGSGVFGP